MLKGCTGIVAAGLVALVAGCHSDRPHEYGQERPPVDRLDPRDAGLQSKDVVSASDQMAMDLLTGVPELHTSTEKWLIVVTPVENYTSDNRQNLNMFVDRLGVKLRQMGRRDIQLVENRDRFHDLQSRELEQGVGSAGLNPNFALYAKISEMRNRGTSYYFMEFRLVALQDTPQHKAKELVWNNAYEVKVNN
jgi:hypothetical protein